MVGERPQDQREIARHRHRRRYMRRDAVGMIDDVRDLGVAEAAEAHSKVERRADDDDHVGIAFEHRTGTAEGQLVIGGKATAAEAVEIDGHAQRFGGGAQRVPRTVEIHVGARDDRGALRGRDQRGRARHRVADRHRAGGAARDRATRRSRGRR